jgi:hypothetical protein
MQILSLGKITVTTAGTPVQATSTSIMAHEVIIEPLAGNSGKSYVGNSTINVSSGAGVSKTFLPPAASGGNDSYRLNARSGDGNTIDVSQFWVDVQTSGQGVTVSYAIV